MSRFNLGIIAVEEKLLPIVEKGSLPEVYNNDIMEWWPDFWPELSWSPEECSQDVRDIITHPRFPEIQDFFWNRFQIDFRAELIGEDEISYRMGGQSR